MGSVSSTNPAITDLLQTLSNLNSPVMSSPAAVSALEKAPSADIVQLSVAATQLEGVDELFGIRYSSNTGASGALTNLEDVAANAQPSSTASSAASSADQMANYQTALQEAETQGLLGAGSAGSLSGSLFDVTG